MAQQKATDSGDAEGASPQAELLDALIASVHRTNVHFDPQKNAPESVLTCGLQGGERVETQGEYHQGRVESAPEQKVEAAVCAGVCRSCCCGQAYGGALWSRSSAGPSVVRATATIHCVPSKARLTLPTDLQAFWEAARAGQQPDAFFPAAPAANGRSAAANT